MNTLPKVPTWSDRGIVDMRRKENRAAFKAARNTKHVQRVWVADNSFSGSRKAWQFSNELLESIKRGLQ